MKKKKSLVSKDQTTKTTKNMSKIKAEILFNAELFYTESWFQKKSRTRSKRRSKQAQSVYMKPCFQNGKNYKLQNGVYRLKGIHLPDIQVKKKSDQSYKNPQKTDRQYVDQPPMSLKKDVQGGYPRSETLTYPDPIILQKCSQRPVVFPS